MQPSIRLVVALVVAVLPHAPALGEVLKVDVQSIKPAEPVRGAQPYEIVSGEFTGEVDPADRRNAIITDLAGAPRNAAGKVEYRATFAIARPVDQRNESGVLLYDVPNRGRGAVTADPGGHVHVISGWQGDIAPSPALQTASVPIARNSDGSAIVGPVLVRLQSVPAATRSTPLGGGIVTPVPRPLPASLDTRLATLTREVRGGPAKGPATTRVPSGDWAFADCRTTPFPGVPDPRQLCLRAGFDADAAYTLVYRGKDPLVLGLGFAATRDLVSYLRSGRPDAMGNLNPARGKVRWVVASGTSQSGNFLRSFVNLGFNEDLSGARVFDGINPNIAARQVPLNLRFGVPGGAAGRFEPGSEGTLWWGPYDDRRRGLGTTSLLGRCNATATCPKVIETIGSAEFWGLRASPGLVGTDGKADLPLPPNVRRYYFPSVTHGGGWGDGFSLTGEPTFNQCVLPGNPNPSDASLRAAQHALIAWVKDGTEPLPSRYPTLAAGQLVSATARAIGWPAIPGAPAPNGKINNLPMQDFGRAFRRSDLSGVMAQPPRITGMVPLFVPPVDSDGNENAGVASVQLQVPLGTYLGWNVMAAGYTEGSGCDFEGGFIPFARTRAERAVNGDPRPSLEERYGDHAGFVARVRAAVVRQQDAGWLLPDDAAAIVRAAEASAVLR